MDGEQTSLVFFVNGKKIVEKDADPETTLLQYLRLKLLLKGTKLACGEGGCGACTVMVSWFNRRESKILHMSVNACLAPLCSMHGMAVTTVEGIGSIKTSLHPVQERIAKSHGSQCGFCTPGIVMSMYTLLRNNPQPSWKEMEIAFEGNLCRCTGYRPILEGFRTFTKEYCCGEGSNCCMNKQGDGEDISSELFQPSEFIPYDPSQEPIFPSELQLSDEYEREYLVFQGEQATWHRPVTLDKLLSLKHQYPYAKLVIGNTEVGVEVKFKNMHYPVLISPMLVAELNTVQRVDDGIIFGGNTSLDRLEHTLCQAVEQFPECKTRMFSAIIEMLRWFAGKQIRNVAAIAGNIMTASPISDLNPLFIAAGCTLSVASKERGQRSIVMDHTFFTGYRKTVVQADEIMISIKIPFMRENEYFYAYKQSQRREDDIAIVNAGIRVLLDGKLNVIKELALGFGGMAPTTVMAKKTADSVIGRKWDDDLVSDICRLLADDLPLNPGAPGGMVEYRRTLTTSFFFKFFLTVQLQLQNSQVPTSTAKVPASYQSATPSFKRDPAKSSQLYVAVSSEQSQDDAVGRPITHFSAEKQATGEATYCDDIPKVEGELYLALVTSTKTLAKIVDVCASEALSMPGVVDYVSYKDIPGKNVFGCIVPDDEVFATDTVSWQGQVIGAIVADTQVHAQRAAKKVKVSYESLQDQQPVVTIEDAIRSNSFFVPSRTLKCGDIDEALNNAEHILEGEMSLGGQEHFYLETQACIVVPKEDKEIEVFISSQHPSEAQEAVAHTLGIPANQVVVRVKRLGGGFGGKESRFNCFLLPVAVAANKLQRPIRCILDRDEDMAITGGRHPFMGKYKVAYSNEGRITGLDLKLYSNCGVSQDLSWPVMERAIFHSDNAYKIPNVRIVGYPCKTNMPSNTAFRGFGGPQGMMICENWMTDVSKILGIPQEKIREINMYKEGDRVHFNQLFVGCNLQRCWEECLQRSDFHRRSKEVNIFNSENRWKKRGIAVIPTKFGISFTATFLNQAGALVHVYTDGSVLLTHGGCEMGQGLHTKMIQVASRALGIPTSSIHISETCTDKVPNTSASAASCSSDLNGMAVIYACQTIVRRLEPFMNANPKGSWEDWVRAAYFDRISLSATGFYKTPDIGYDWESNSGNPFAYFTQGVACSEVEIDCLTGDHQVLRTDIVMDVGNSLNPAIDIGQIEGGFIQGYGLFTMEQPKFSPDGFIYTRGPGTYKIPGFGDIPVEFNVSLLTKSENLRAVYSSKAIGEPPLFLASSIFFAIKDAISSARADVGLLGQFRLDSPATAERIRMACEDQFTNQFPPAEKGTYKPWFLDA